MVIMRAHNTSLIIIITTYLLLYQPSHTSSQSSSSSSSSSSTGTSSFNSSSSSSSSTAPPPTWYWDNTLFGPCSSSCGPGLQYSLPRCFDSGVLQNDTSVCQSPPPPLANQVCVVKQCLTTWRADLRCGANYPAPDGSTLSTCNPLSNFPCCSPSTEYCASTEAACTCQGCIDYRNVNGTSTPALDDSSAGISHTGMILAVFFTVVAFAICMGLGLLKFNSWYTRRKAYATPIEHKPEAANNAQQSAIYVPNRPRRAFGLEASSGSGSSGVSTGTRPAPTSGRVSRSSVAPSLPGRGDSRSLSISQSMSLGVVPRLVIVPSSTPPAAASTIAPSPASSTPLANGASFGIDIPPTNSEFVLAAISPRDIEFDEYESSRSASPNESPEESEIMVTPPPPLTIPPSKRDTLASFPPVHLHMNEPSPSPTAAAAVRLPTSFATHATSTTPPPLRPSPLSSPLSLIDRHHTTSFGSRLTPLTPIRTALRSPGPLGSGAGSSAPSSPITRSPHQRHAATSPTTPERLRRPSHHQTRGSELSPTRGNKVTEAKDTSSSSPHLSPAAATAFDTCSPTSSLEGPGLDLTKPDRCTICLSAPANALAIPCGHNSFCFTCLTRWNEQKRHCPVCRHKVQQISLKSLPTKKDPTTPKDNSHDDISTTSTVFVTTTTAPPKK